MVSAYEEDIEDIAEQEEKELQDKTLARISEVKKLTAQLRSLHRDIARLRNEEKIKKKMAAVKNIKAATAEKIESIGLNSRYVDRILNRLKDLSYQIRKSEREMVSCIRKLGYTRDKIDEALKNIRKKAGT